ncbi:glycosyltransferase family 4 protein [Halorussus salilacus]|uniref:glycosyltransferase family 4 protein n=1 Tax=Halorussus salilacus TaxID=2953750 RepID=UPI00209FB6A4|nr:glycosyltransferase family 4 protein [Halorussus salilacus]USZ68047.1 glycosyltransferase family 4 protein [Halorussus salilacus]
MDPDAARVAMLHQDPHPAHRGFAEAVGADLVDYHRLSVGPLEGSVAEDALNGLAYPDYDVYLVEGSRPLYAALARRFTRGGKLVYLGADHGLYQLGNPDFEGSSGVKSLVGRFGTPAVRAVGRRGIDGVVAVSEFVAEFTRPVVGPDTPIEIAHPFVQPDAYDALGEVTPALDANVAVTVARPWAYKGVDMLVDAWPRVREAFPDAELHVVGGGHPESYAETPGVRVRGYVEDLADAFRPASLFVQPSRMDAFPVSTLEAMRAGVPPLVTRTAGTRSEAREIDPGLVVETNEYALSRGVREYFDRDPDDRRELARRARERGERFDPDSRKAAFREAFRDVLKEL